jgi:hypothetical protein
MLFGQTLEQAMVWRKKFALIPHELTDGRWAWLRTIEYRDANEHCGRCGREHRLPEVE